MQIGLLMTGHAPEAMLGAHGDYDAIFARLLQGHGISLVPYAVVDGVFPESVRAAEGWVITGSRHGVYEDHPWLPPLEAFIRDAHAARVPLVGICFGHQIVAQALGGRVEKHAGGWIVGPQSYRFADGRTIALNAWHQDQVIEPPDLAETLATGPDCAHAALAYGDRALTLQAHPEFTPAFVADLIAHRGPGVVPEDRLSAAAAAADRPLDQAAVAAWIADFLRRPRAD